jgi:hypothetical protein
MSLTPRRFVLVTVLGLTLTAAGIAGGVLTDRRVEPAPDTTDPLEAPVWREIRMMEAALDRQDVWAAVRARQAAHQQAIAARGWRVMLAVGDATVRLEEAKGSRALAISEARRAYLAALYRARQDGSLDGVLRSARAFAALGDRNMVTSAIHIAEDMAERSPDPAASSHVREIAGRLAFAESRNASR